MSVNIKAGVAMLNDMHDKQLAQQKEYEEARDALPPGSDEWRRMDRGAGTCGFQASQYAMMAKAIVEEESYTLIDFPTEVARAMLPDPDRVFLGNGRDGNALFSVWPQSDGTVYVFDIQNRWVETALLRQRIDREYGVSIPRPFWIRSNTVERLMAYILISRGLLVPSTRKEADFFPGPELLAAYTSKMYREDRVSDGWFKVEDPPEGVELVTQEEVDAIISGKQSQKE